MRMLGVVLIAVLGVNSALGWGGLFNRFSPEMLSNLGYGGHGGGFRVQPFLQVKVIMVGVIGHTIGGDKDGELYFKVDALDVLNVTRLSGVPQHNTNPGALESLQELGETDEGPCYGRRCVANEFCCPGSVCVDVDGIGSCMFPYGLSQGELCRRHSDCETGLVCADTGDTKTCQPPFTAPKQYSEECTMSSECDIHKGLCCQFQRRHRQVARKVCSYFKDPLVCIGPVASDQVKVDLERTAGEKRITGKAAAIGFNHLR